MNIENVLTEGLSGNAKQKIDNWFKASRPSLLKLLNVTENENYPFVYHECKSL